MSRRSRYDSDELSTLDDNGIASLTNRSWQPIYSHLPNVTVEELLIDHSDLNTKRMLDLMAVGTGVMPLYLHVVKRVLRDMRVLQQQNGTPFVYANFKQRMAAEKLSEAQNAPLQQRLETLESFMPKGQTTVSAFGGKKQNKGPSTGTDWTAKVSANAAQAERAVQPGVLTRPCVSRLGSLQSSTSPAHA